MAQDELGRGIARADLCRFLAACYYQPGPEFAEEKLFDSMAAVAARVDPDFAARARRLGEAFAAEDPEDLLVDYTRLFLGPVDALAKPYGSVWLGGAAGADAGLDDGSPAALRSRAASRSTRTSASCPTTSRRSSSSCTC